MFMTDKMILPMLNLIFIIYIISVTGGKNMSRKSIHVIPNDNQLADYSEGSELDVTVRDIVCKMAMVAFVLKNRVMRKSSQFRKIKLTIMFIRTSPGKMVPWANY